MRKKIQYFESLFLTELFHKGCIGEGQRKPQAISGSFYAAFLQPGRQGPALCTCPPGLLAYLQTVKISRFINKQEKEIENPQAHGANLMYYCKGKFCRKG